MKKPNYGRLLPAALLALSLWGVASLPGSDLSGVQTAPENPMLRLVLSDPFMHAATLALLTLLIGAAWGAYGKAAALALGYGLLIELYQWLLPWRTFGLDDLIWNAVGVAIAWAVLKMRQGWIASAAAR